MGRLTTVDPSTASSQALDTSGTTPNWNTATRQRADQGGSGGSQNRIGDARLGRTSTDPRCEHIRHPDAVLTQKQQVPALEQSVRRPLLPSPKLPPRDHRANGTHLLALSHRPTVVGAHAHAMEPLRPLHGGRHAHMGLRTRAPGHPARNMDSGSSSSRTGGERTGGASIALRMHLGRMEIHGRHLHARHMDGATTQDRRRPSDRRHARGHHAIHDQARALSLPRRGVNLQSDGRPGHARSNKTGMGNRATERTTQPTLDTSTSDRVRDETHILFFDGGSRGNPGPGGSGSVVVRLHLATMSASIQWAASMAYGNHNTTNNVAEYWGLLHGLRFARASGIRDIHVVGDSTLIVSQQRRHRPPRANKLVSLYREVRAVADEIGVASWTHHYRQHNKMADSAANYAMDTRASQQTLALSERGLLQLLGTFLENDIACWIESSTAAERQLPSTRRGPTLLPTEQTLARRGMRARKGLAPTLRAVQRHPPPSTG